MSGNNVEGCESEFALSGAAKGRSRRMSGRHRRARTATPTVAVDMTPGVHISHAAPTSANSAPRRVRRRRAALRPAITGGLAVLGATALVGTFVTPAPAEARATTYAVSAPTPTPLLAALTLPFDAAQLQAAAAAVIDLDFDGVFRFNSDLVDLLARLGASLRVDVDIDLDAEELAAAFADLINAIAIGIDGGIEAANDVVDLGAALVSEIALAAAGLGVDLVDAFTGALVSLLASITPEGGVGADLSAAIGGAIEGIGELISTGFIGAGSAVAWKATLDDVLFDLVATGGIALTNGVAGSLLAALGIDADLDLPDIDGEDVAVSLGALIEHFTDGINGALLTGGGAVELGVDLINGLVEAAAEGGVDIRGAITGVLLSSLAALVPVGSPGAPFAEAVVEFVGDISADIDAGIRGMGEAIAWKFTLDDLLVDVGVAGGVSLVNGLTTALFGGIGLPLPELPEVDFAASVRALINHFAVALGLEIDLEAGGEVEVDPNEEIDPNEEVELLGGEEGDSELVPDGFKTLRVDLTGEETDPDAEQTPLNEQKPADDAGDQGLGGDDLGEEELGEEDLGEEDLDEEELPGDDVSGDVTEETAEESEDGGEEAGEAGDAGDAGGETGGDTGGETANAPSTD
uniref:Uncharacterized protein n=1 Tax=Mycobacterium sp. (strain JLS) TaxID=164757 RepID=A0A5Q5CFY5_MYCSJ